MRQSDQLVIPWQRPVFWGNEKRYVTDALESTWISGGAYIERLEHELSRILGRKHALTCSNGTTALLLSYLSLGLQPGDEVIVPGFAFMAAANMALHMKLKPVFAEVDRRTWCITADAVEAKITSRTRIIVPIHSYGNVCNMPEIMELAKRKKLVVIEDCAESIFSEYDSQYCGTFGRIGTFSFHAAKTITTGEGGLVVTDSDKAYRQMLLCRNQGFARPGTYYHEVAGYNFRLTNLQAALGCAQLEQIETIISERKRIHQGYIKQLRGRDAITLQHFPGRVNSVLWAIAVRLDTRAFPQGRDTVMQQLRERNIETRPGFVASSLLPIYEPHSLPICEEISRNTISLPTFAALQDEQIEFICAQLLSLKR